MQKKYAIGVDFGTLSGRAVLVELDTGREVATAVKSTRMVLWMNIFRRQRET